MKYRHLDFDLIEDCEWNSWGTKVKMRFYPMRSHVHGFGDDCPKDWKSVYKVYYCWRILQYEKWAGKEDWDAPKPMFEMMVDECSALVNLADHLRYVLKKKSKYHSLISYGQPGSDWEIKYRKYWNTFGEKAERVPEMDFVDISVWNSYTEQGYRFILKIKQCEKFIEYLDRVNEHMLENSEPI